MAPDTANLTANRARVLNARRDSIDMPVMTTVRPAGAHALMRAALYSFVVLILIAGMGGPVVAGILPSQKTDAGQYQQRRVAEERVDESFYMQFERDSKKYDAYKKARINVYLKDKLKKSSTMAETDHYSRLLRILNGR